jgi:hypothetical protein
MTQTVNFTVDQVNDILQALGDIPARHSMALIKFIRETAESQLKQPEAPLVSDDSVTEVSEVI